MKKILLILLVISTLFIIAAKKPKPPQGIAGYEIVQEPYTVPAGAAMHDIEISCPASKVVLGGGVQGWGVQETYPGDGGLSWIVSVDNSGVESMPITVYAICADVAQ